jgi:hypothetical protein
VGRIGRRFVVVAERAAANVVVGIVVDIDTTLATVSKR